jgi:hypothetical protein
MPPFSLLGLSLPATLPSAGVGKRRRMAARSAFFATNILALRLTRRRLTIRLHPLESAALEHFARRDREIEERLMREFLGALEDKLDSARPQEASPVAERVGVGWL